jgi:hypothetical protein
MADNLHIYGFRPYAPKIGAFTAPVRMTVASAQDDVDSSANSVHIWPGDPLKTLTTGGVKVALTTEAVSYVCCGIEPYYDASTGVMKHGKYYPNQTTWGTVEARRGYVLCYRADAYIWEIDCDDATTATTKAAYVALINGNCEFTTPGNTTMVSVDPYLDISDLSGDPTDVDAGLRCVGISETIHNRDFSGNYVKLLVEFNHTVLAGAPEASEYCAGLA